MLNLISGTFELHDPKLLLAIEIYSRILLSVFESCSIEEEERKRRLHQEFIQSAPINRNYKQKNAHEFLEFI